MVEWRVMLLCVILMVLHPRLASAQLTLYHGRVASNNVDLDQVEGVAVLNLGGPMISHFFDCHTATGSPSDLVWSREGGFQRFPTAPANIVIDEQGLDVLRMDMAPPNDDIVGYSDADIYTCTNSQSGESVSINITGGATAVCAVEPSYDVNLDGTAELRVYEAGDPPLTSSDIVWRSPRGERIASGGRLTLHDKNTRLVIRNVGLEDSGTYTINVEREITLGVFRTLGTTTTELNVHVGPEVTSNPAPMEILEHNMVTLTCIVRGNPSPDVVWEREGSEPLPVTTRRDITRTSMLNNSVTLYTVTSNLIIHNVLFEDQGRYRCVATNTVTGGAERTDSSTLAQLTVIPRLQLTATPPIMADSNLLRVAETTFVQVSCSGSGNLNWRSVSGAAIEVNTELIPSVNRYQFFDFTNNIQLLVVQSFASADSDLYVCTSDLVVSGSADVVSTSLFITTADPAVYFAEGTVYATLGSTAELEVSVHTSSSNPLTVQWYHEGSLLDTANDPRYSTSAESASLRALIVSGVASNILGRYLVAVTVDGRTENATVSLQLPEPPTVSVVPTSQGTSEHENATFQCVAGGTRSTIQWTSTGNQPLPGGVTQEGDGLFVQQASRDHAGMYECHVTNQAGTVVGSALLTVFYAPTAIITREGTPQTSISNQLLEVEATQEDPAPTFSCSSDGVPPPTLSWGGLDGGTALPSGVTRQSPSDRDSRDLVWGRELVYTDSGRYVCTAVNSNGTSTATLSLLVRLPPTITSIFPRLPVNTSAEAIYSVPLGYSGPVITCAAFGWPTPSIEWRRNGQSLTGRVVSESVIRNDVAFVSAELRLTGEFAETDTGVYTCVVRANDTNAMQMKDITLEVGSNTGTTSPTPPPCSLDSHETFFEIRVLDTDCESWGDELREHIASSFLADVMNAVSAECPDCTVNAEDMALASGPDCSTKVTRAAVFRGAIATATRSQTEAIFCALSRWQESGPLVLINGNFNFVDQSCSIELESLDRGECVDSSNPVLSDDLLPIIVGAAAGGVVILVILPVIVLVLCCCVCGAASKKSKDLKNSTSCQNSNYERTCHADPASLTRYTDRINPEPRTPLSICSDGSTGDHLYSTLNRSEMDSYPPPPPMTHPGQDTDILRKDSRSLLLEETVDGRMPFQIVQDGYPEPYQVAVSSRENLYTASEGSGFLANQTTSSSSGSAYSTQHMKLNHTLSSNSAVPSPTSSSSLSGRRNVSAVNPVSSSSSDYEQIDRKYGVNNFSNSSPRLFDGTSGKPTRVASAGQVRGIGQERGLGPDRRFQRHLSAVENASRKEDYSQLNRVQQQPGFSHPIIAANRRGSRGQSISSVFTSTPTSTGPPQQFPLARLDKRNSVTNYSRSSPSPTDSQNSCRPLQVCTPTSEAPPPYRSNPSSPYSPSGSSMLENGAYEGINPHAQTIMVHEGLKSDDNVEHLELEEQQPWYHSASDFSLEHNPPQTDGLGGGAIAPYSQVSNSEIDSRRVQESSMVLTSSVPRFSISGNVRAAPYSEPISSVENLSRVHQTSSHMHTVAV